MPPGWLRRDSVSPSHWWPRVTDGELEELPLPAVACDGDEELVVANRRARKLHGMRRGRVPLDRWAAQERLRDRGTGALLPAQELPLMRALRGEDVHDVEVAVQTDHGRRTFSVDGGPVAAPPGGRSGALVVMSDVTARLAREDHWRAQGYTVEALPSAVALTGAADGRFVWVNPSWERMFGYGRDDILGSHVSLVNAAGELTPQDRGADILGALDHDGLWRGELEHVRRDGTHFWSAAEISRCDHPQHGLVWLAVHTDVTDQKTADRELRDAAERYWRIFEQAPIGMALVGRDLRILDVNAALCRLVGHEQSELVNRPLADIAHPDDRELDVQLVARLLHGEIPEYRLEERYVTADGVTVPVGLTVTLVRSGLGEPLFALVLAYGR